MNLTRPSEPSVVKIAVGLLLLATLVVAQMIDRNKAPNAANEGIRKTLAEQIGAGRGNVNVPRSSSFLIARDPFRSIRRGRQLFQRKFTRAEGLGPLTGDGSGDINTTLIIGAGLADSCAACHGRPRGAAGVGGDVATRPDSRDAPHLFGLGLKEMLADEITTDLRNIRTQALAAARNCRCDVGRALVSKGIHYGTILARANGTVDTSQVRGVDADLRVRPFFLHGETISIREFVVGALKAEMGLQAVDPDLARASTGGKMTTLSGMVLDGATDKIEAPVTADPNADPDRDGVSNEIPASLVDHFEFYLLNYFKAGTGEQNDWTVQGRQVFQQIGCATCHVPDLQINRDRRVADVETVFDSQRGIFNRLFATATPLFIEQSDGPSFPTLKRPALKPFLVKNIFTDFKRHDLGPNFHERNYDGTIRREFLTTPLWGVGTTAPYGHDGRSINLNAVILRHGGEAQSSRNNFNRLSFYERQKMFAFLESLVLFPPDDTASNLDPGNASTPGFPQFGHGSIRLTTLFNDPTDIE
jgi:hypothetical protein